MAEIAMKPFKCSKCEREFPSQPSLNSHMQAHKQKPPTRAAVKLRQDKAGTTRADVPVSVIHLLGGREGDQIVFELGCERAVMEAALRGPYVVVRLVRAPVPQPAQMQVSGEATERVSAHARQSEAVPFADLVKQKIEGRSAQ